MARVVVAFVFGSRLASWQLCLMLTNNRPVLVHLLPIITSRLLYFTSHLILESVTSQSVLHSLTIDSRECAASPGTMCPSCASIGSCGMFNSQVCIDCIWSPSGIVTWRGLSAGCLLVVGAVVGRK